MKAIRWLAGSICAILAASPVGAATLYKSVSASGVIQFSDTPPDEKSMIVEARPLSGSATKVALLAPAVPLSEAVENDESLMRAYAQVDFAEHALALARRAVWAESEGGLRLASARANQADYERVEYYKRGVVAARQMLMEVLRARNVR